MEGCKDLCTVNTSAWCNGLYIGKDDYLVPIRSTVIGVCILLVYSGDMQPHDVIKHHNIAVLHSKTQYSSL